MPNETECVDVIHGTVYNASLELCDAVFATESCKFDDGFIQYIHIVYCAFQFAPPLGVVLMFLWLLVMLIGLATTADVFFGPCLIVMADTLRLSQNVAGVTLLALGNGAPDIFSAISAITNLKADDAGLAFGALLGAGIFVTSVTAGAIALVKPFTAMSRPLLKDIVFYLFIIFWTFVIMMKESITIFESVGFIVVYAIYVFITVGSRALYSQGIGAGGKNKEEAGDGQEESGNDQTDAAPDRADRAVSPSTGTYRKRQNDYFDPVIVEDLARFEGHPSDSTSGVTNPTFDLGDDEEEKQRQMDEAAGYDTSLDFPGGLQRVESGRSEQGGHPATKNRSRRFQELEGLDSPRSSTSRRPSRLDERMRRVSRVQRHMEAAKLSNAGAEEAPEAASGGRKISTTSFTGVNRRANYFTRWMLAYGDLSQVEHRSRHASVAGPAPQLPSNQERRAGKLSATTPPRQRSESVGAPTASTGTHRRLSDSRDGTRPEAGAVSAARALGAARPAAGHARGYKLSGGLGMDVPMAYFQRKESREEQKRSSDSRRESSDSRRGSSDSRRESGDSADGRDIVDSSSQAAEPPVRGRRQRASAAGESRWLYRIESVDEQLDDDTLDRLNRLNMQAERERQLEEEEEERRRRRDRLRSANDQDSEERKEEAKEKEKEGQDEEEEELSPLKEFAYSLIPLDQEEFPGMSWYNKAYEIVKAPILFLLLLTTPLVDYDQPLNGWSRFLNCLHCVTGPLFVALAFRGHGWVIGSTVPVLPFIGVLGLLLAIGVFFTSSNFEPPKYHAVFSFLGFFIAIVWIYTFANEVVNVLESAGFMFNISSTILGLTVLAWANSIGDVISNTVLARQNFPRVAISACFGGPLFNLLLGVGIPFTIKMASEGTASVKIGASLVQIVLVTSVAASLILSMIYLTVTRFRVNKPLGIALFCLYGVFLVVAMLAETGVITLPK